MRELLLRSNGRMKLPQRGFTLVEFIVVVAIVLVMSVLILVGHNKFNGNILLSNLAYDMALSIRQAQTYGLGAREATRGGSDFETGYGIRFSTANPDTYILFADLDRDSFYDGGNELVETFTLGQGYTVSDFCVTSSSGNESCSLTYIDIVFDRPEPDAIIRRNGNSITYASARIIVESDQGTERIIFVAASGQIGVVR